MKPQTLTRMTIVLLALLALVVVVGFFTRRAGAQAAPGARPAGMERAVFFLRAYRFRGAPNNDEHLKLRARQMCFKMDGNATFHFAQGHMEKQGQIVGWFVDLVCEAPPRKTT